MSNFNNAVTQAAIAATTALANPTDRDLAWDASRAYTQAYKEGMKDDSTPMEEVQASQREALAWKEEALRRSV